MAVYTSCEPSVNTFGGDKSMSAHRSALEAPEMPIASSWNNGQLFSSASVEWGTPDWVFDHFNDGPMGPFDLDAAACAHNTTCANFIGPKRDALKTPWEGKRVWLNPPWGRGIGKWVQRAWEQSMNGNVGEVVCLLPASTDTAWWHDVVMKHAQEVLLIRGRLHFIRDDGHTGPCTKGSAIVIFNRAHSAGRPRFSSKPTMGTLEKP